MKVYCKIVKPVFDFVFALVSIILLSPVLIVITVLLIYYNSGSPFFLQLRPGRHGQIFRIVKFKTMNDKKDDLGKLLPDVLRITRFGNFIRKASLDELPQLLSILKGDMSLIGPRPLLIEYLPLYNHEQARRHEVKPGITGWAQVIGRNAISWEEKFRLDVYYVDHISLRFDIKIFFLTIGKVFKREGINYNASLTMEKFTGSNS